MADSLQHKMDQGRVRPPRVQITYDVETGGKMQKIELPFVVGVLADLSGQREEPLPPVKQRQFIPIDRDNFNGVLAKQAPRLAMRVQNRLTKDDNKLNVELNFQSMDDFQPDRVAQQIEPLRQLLEMRRRLTELESRMEGNDKLEQMLADVLSNTDKALNLAKQMGIEGPTSTPAANPENAS